MEISRENFPENPRIVEFPKCKLFNYKILEVLGAKSNGTEKILVRNV